MTLESGSSLRESSLLFLEGDYWRAAGLINKMIICRLNLVLRVGNFTVVLLWSVLPCLMMFVSLLFPGGPY